MVAPALNDAAPPTLAFDLDVSNFQPDLPTHRPRAWDRLPKSPYANRRKGRKVWKRYEPSLKSTRGEKENHIEDAELVAGTAELNGTHAAKRLRAKDAPIDHEDEATQKPSKYITTLRDKVSGTPKRKMASRRSLRLDRLKGSASPVVEKGDNIQVADPSRNELAQLEPLKEDEVCEVDEDPMEPMEGPLAEDVEEALSSPMSEKLVEEDLSPNQGPDVLLSDFDDNQSEPESTVQVQPAAEDHEVLDEEPSDTTPTRDHRSAPYISSSSSEDNVAHMSPVIGSGDNDVEAIQTLQRGDEAEEAVSAEDPDNSSTSEVQIQIFNGIETPKSRSEDRVNEIVSESTSQNQLRRSSRRASERNKQETMNHQAAERHPTIAVAEMAELDTEQSGDTLALEISQVAPDSPSKSTIQSGEQSTSDENPEKGADSSIAQTGKRLYKPERLEAVTIKQPTTQNIDDNTTQCSTDGTIYNEVKATDPENEFVKSPRKSARSGPRFSDDTVMLKDFLSRAQARKQAKGASSTAGPLAAATSPRRSPRKALASLDSNSPSPHKAREVANRAGTPPGKVKLGEVQLEDVDETTGDASPVRRSTRKRLPGPAKTATGAPSFIPVRRADGTDPVVLQKSVAQELALVTRTNTRRNKGQAKPPAIILKSLNVEEVEEETKGGHALRSCKSVGWDKKLVYYQDGMEGQADGEVKVEEKRPKARRLRGLGAGNGTPAPKRRTADVLSSNGTPASKRHGRMR
ncbi:MAG: hypothetical protein Q9225_004397 [Loekoesia sp. 1 TL-2023]